MPQSLEFTGERFVPGIPGEIELEHVHRYAFARALVGGRRVLDCACGEGYGSALLAGVAREVAGVDIDAVTLAHARQRYEAIANLSWHCASAAALPFADGSFEAIVSFETLEHLPLDLQRAMLAEFARVLAPGGLLVLSSPNRVEYSDKRGYRNPFHLHEHDRAELDALLEPAFPARITWHQRVWLGSLLWREDAAGATAADALIGGSAGVEAAGAPPAMYYVVLAARDARDLPSSAPPLSLLGDRGGAEHARLEAQGAEVVRLDALLGERTAALDRASEHVMHLESLVAFREGLIVERDAALQRHDAERARLDGLLDEQRGWSKHLEADVASLNEVLREQERSLAAQERIIAYRAGARWWLELPWLRLRGAWRRMRGS